MYFVLSPAKKLEESRVYPQVPVTEPVLLQDTEALMAIMKTQSPLALSQLMGISDALAVKNMARYQNMLCPPNPDDLFPAAFLFNGDAYQGLMARELAEPALDYLSKHLGILSGLYGLLSAFDAIYPYRLEMGVSLENPKGKDLYAFWTHKIAMALSQKMAASKDDVLINLASQEYFKPLQKSNLSCSVIQPIFKEYKNGQYKVISFYAKRARGLMVRFAAQNNIQDAEILKEFDLEGYEFSASSSDETRWVFTRG